MRLNKRKIANSVIAMFVFLCFVFGSVLIVLAVELGVLDLPKIEQQEPKKKKSLTK